MMKQTKGRILCVDDDGDTREMMSELLGLEGYEVVAAQSVAQGLSEAVASNYDLILLDWIFSDGTGVDLCKMIRSTGIPAPILFYSGLGFNAEIDDAMHAGAQGFLIKPVDVAELLQSVARLVGDGHSRLGPN
jgi:DNA-binding response OmpR family regulator